LAVSHIDSCGGETTGGVKTVGEGMRRNAVRVNKKKTAVGVCDDRVSFEANFNFLDGEIKGTL
jgi:hypothetical protein